METKLILEPITPKKYIDLNYVTNYFILRQQIQNNLKILQIQNYSESLKKWIENFRIPSRDSMDVRHLKIKKIDLQRSQIVESQNELNFFFQKYLKTIKPVINDFFSLISTLNPQEFAFYSTSLSQDQVNQLVQIFEPIRKFKILNKQASIQGRQLLSREYVNQITRKGVPIYKMNLQIPPQNDEIRFWGSTMQINPFTIIGTVTKGKGLGKQGLGMPTANIKISPQMNESLSEYPNGIYITTIKINGKPDVYVGASSLGTNPHYENSTSKRILQTYIIHDFQEQMLYGEELVTQFHELIRLQFKFNDFSAFLNGMRNDIEIAKNWGISHNLIKQ